MPTLWPFKPEELDLSTLPWFPLHYHEWLPRCPALYFVLGPDKAVLYIGRTIALRHRWKHHHRLNEYVSIQGVTIAWLFSPDYDLLPALEAACIAYFHPRDNRTRPSFLTDKNGKVLDTPLRMARKSRDLRLQEVARTIGVTHPTLAGYETARIDIPMSKALALARYYGCTLNELFDPEEEHTCPTPLT